MTKKRLTLNLIFLPLGAKNVSLFKNDLIKLVRKYFANTLLIDKANLIIKINDYEEDSDLTVVVFSSSDLGYLEQFSLQALAAPTNARAMRFDLETRPWEPISESDAFRKKIAADIVCYYDGLLGWADSPNSKKNQKQETESDDDISVFHIW